MFCKRLSHLNSAAIFHPHWRFFFYKFTLHSHHSDDSIRSHYASQPQLQHVTNVVNISDVYIVTFLGYLAVLRCIGSMCSISVFCNPKYRSDS